MINPKLPAYNASLIYILFVIIIIITKPCFMYNYQNNKFKEFGYTNNKTIFTLPLMCILFAIVIYLFFSVIEAIFIKFDL